MSSEIDIIESLAQLSTLAVKQSQTVADRVGIHPIDLESIEWLMRNPGATAGALGKAMGLTSGAVTGLLRRLTAHGFIQTRPDDLDGRKLRIYCKSKKISLRISPHYESIIQRTKILMANYKTKELSVVARFLGEICSLEEADPAVSE